MKKLLFQVLLCIYVNAAAQWTQQVSGVNSFIESVHFLSADTGYVSGDDGVILKTVNGGQTWISQSHPPGSTLSAIRFWDVDTGYTVGNYGTIKKTTNGGATWLDIINNNYNSLMDICYVSASNIYASGFYGTIIHSTDAGNTWTLLNSNNNDVLCQIFFLDSDTGYVVGGNGTILKTTNKGVNWYTQYSGVTSELRGIYFLNKVTGFIVGLNGTILKTTNGGQTWVQITSPTTNHLIGIHFVTPNTGFIAGFGGKILKTNNGGNTWGQQNSTTTNNLADIFFSNGVGYAVGGYGTILKTTQYNTLYANVALTTPACNGECNGVASVNVLGGIPPYTYSWHGLSDTTFYADSLCAGNTYYVTVTDSNGYSKTDSLSLPAINPFNIQLTSNAAIICPTDSAVICATAGYNAYAWNNGSTGECITTNQAGNYYATVTDSRGCASESAHISLAVYPASQVAVSVNNDTLTAYNASSYQWYLNGIPINGATQAVYVVTETGMYSVGVTDANDCYVQSNPIAITDITNIADDFYCKIYPNPTNNILCIDIKSKVHLNNQMSIFDINGKLIYTNLLKDSNSIETINTTNMAAGMYTIEIKTDDYSKRYKFLIAR